ncbi:ketoacyl-ACP synthase III family protein [Streptomyces sp. CA-249302]|uniref:ketoacyl-ACP synthase III family protein n=1 Tax=Streptomyces sp. CA-249302 TaxID=3240058 RepID=UPI003D92C150
MSAALSGLAEAGEAPRGLGLVACSWVMDSPSGWKWAPRLARLVGASRAAAFGVQQMSNGGATALQIAVTHLMSEPRTRAALVLTGDALGPESLRRWQLRAIGTALGDGATALVLTRHTGRLVVRSIASYGSPEQERGLPLLNPVRPGPLGAEADQALFDDNSLFLLRRCVREAVANALQDAELAAQDDRLAAVVHPRMTSSTLQALVASAVPTTGARSICLAAETGHLFSGDLAANLHHLLERDVLAPGECALLISFGGGFSATAVVVERVAE